MDIVTILGFSCFLTVLTMAGVGFLVFLAVRYASTGITRMIGTATGNSNQQTAMPVGAQSARPVEPSVNLNRRARELDFDAAVQRYRGNQAESPDASPQPKPGNVPDFGAPTRRLRKGSPLDRAQENQGGQDFDNFDAGSVGLKRGRDTRKSDDRDIYYDDSDDGGFF